MSGIAGMFLKDGMEVGQAEMSCMATNLKHRGPDGSRIWRQGPIGLLHCALYTTPESVSERLPAANPTGTVVITADARIDNRLELIDRLGLTGPQSGITDSELIRAAYETWGHNCPGKLLGDFVFVIWDATRRQLFCGRDPMGVKTLYYFDSLQLFAFASEIKSLVCLEAIPRELNEVRVADFLVNMFDDREITFYKGVKRLPAASTLAVSREQLRIERYWDLDVSREVKLKSDAEYAEAFRDIFTQAVRCRVRSAFPVASTLSGGLDSSAIACLGQQLLSAQGKRLHTLSAIFPGAPASDLEAIDERQYIEAALATGNFEPHYIRADELSPMRQNDRMHFHLDEANFAPNLYLHWAMYEEAEKHGVRVLLDGFDGDTAVSHGFARLPELLFSMRWGTLAEELRLVKRNLLPSSSVRRIFWNLCVKPSAPVWAFQLKRLMQGRIHELKGNPTLIEPSFADDIGIESRVRQMSASRFFRPKSTRARHFEGLSDPTYAWALEAADKSAAAFGIEARYPFFDRRLIEFCLALPAEQKLGQGWNRVVMRRGTEGILPQEIQWRPKKGNLSSNFYRKLLDCEGSTLEEVVRSPEPASFARFVSKPAMQAAYQRFQSAPMRNNQQAVQLFAAVNLALWLRQSAMPS